MDDLIAFVTAQLDAEEARMRDPRYMWQTDWSDIAGPGRLLADVAAKRALLAEYARWARNDSQVDGVEYADGWATGLGFAVRALASAWSDRPGYRPEWAPAPA